ncbi:hypothetical protein ABW20_dc0100268 [Dactylellina cionopaga]|nr:hypothetical protein ABW20_dc0100268 [Dactylellina cionopaga]
MATKRARPRDQSGETLERTDLEKQSPRSTKKAKTVTSDTNFRDDEAVTDSDEDAMYLEQTQRLAANSMILKENEPVDYGTIELVRLENFMCHSCLEMKFGPFMNFVVGQNGSGKSAVLTALTLCLGAKAAVTNRGGNIKSFIKEGEHMASVEVHLRNRGDGFKKDVYGQTIVVQRTFNRDGVNSYKTKTKSGKTISTTKKELSDIIDYMSLQVDNPMTILSQDLARQFLSNSTDEDKYKFFMKGVQLDDLYALYQTMKAQQTTIENVLDTKAEDIRELKEDKDEAEKRFRLLKQTEDLRNGVQELLLKHAWAQVSELETLFEESKNNISICQNSRQELETEREKATSTISIWEEKAAEARAAMESSSDSNNPLTAEKKDLEDKIKQQTYKIDKVQQEERLVHQHLKQAKGKIDKAKRDTDLEKQRLADIDNGKHSSLVEEKEGLSSEKLRIEKAQTDLEISYENEMLAASNAKANLQQVEEVLKRKNADLQSAEDTLRMLTSDRSNNLAAYGNNTDKLLQDIDRVQWTAGKPIGPIGLLVKLRQKNWSSILEKQLAGVLSGFIALSLEDKDRLMGLIRQHKCTHAVYYNNPKSFQLREPVQDYMTILRALEIDNEEVRKVLVTINNIEQTILVEDHVEGRRVMERCPENVKFCYSLNRQKRGNGFNIRMGQGSGGVDPIVGWKGPNRIATDIEEQLRVLNSRNELEGQLKILNTRIRESETESDTLQGAHNLAIKQREQAVLANSNLLQKIEAQDAKIEDLKATAADREADLQGMKLEAERVGARITLGNKETLKKIESQLNKLNAELEKKDAKIGASTEQIAKDFADKTEKFNDARKEVDDLEKIHKALDQAFEERMERWRYFRKHISFQSRMQFHFLMSEREFDGKLAFDHQKGILQLKARSTLWTFLQVHQNY